MEVRNVIHLGSEIPGSSSLDHVTDIGISHVRLSSTFAVEVGELP